MNRIILYLFTIIIIEVISCNDPDSTKIATEQNNKKFDTTDIKKDALFAVGAADGSMLEVKLGALAESYAVTPEVKQLGKMMVEDHSKAGDELKKIAADNNISIPDSLSSKSQKTYTALMKKNGINFDKAYTQLMVEDHTKDINDFTNEAQTGSDTEVKTWATKTLPVLEHHLAMSDSTNALVKFKQ